MKTLLIILMLTTFSISSVAFEGLSGGASCDKVQTGGDAWPWSVAKPFPWDNIEGYWALGDEMSSYLTAHVLSTTNNRKILSLSVLDEGICSKPYAKGTGYIDITDKNIVRTLVNDGVFKYQLKLGMFDGRDVFGLNSCSNAIMGLSIQVISRVNKKNSTTSGPLDPSVTEIRNMVLKKVSIDVDNACKVKN